MEDFDAFWASYPNKKAKLDAMKAYQQARRLATAEDILAGVERYKRIKPEWCEWKLPAGWLRAGRWMDEDDAPVPVLFKEFWGDVCKREHGSKCRSRWEHDTRMQDERRSA